MDARRALIDAAKNTVAARGADAASVAAIAAKAGVAKGLLFYYFASKDGLLRAVAGEIDADYAAGLSALPAQGTCLERLAALIRHHFEFLERDRDGAQFLYHTAAAGCETLRFYEHLHEAILDLLRQGAQAGEFHAQDSEEAAYMLLGSLHGVGRLKLFEFKRDYDAARHLAEFFGRVLTCGHALPPEARS